MLVAIIGLFIIILFSSRPYLQVSKVVNNPSKYFDTQIQVIGIIDGFSGGNFNLTEGENYILIDTADVTIPSGLADGIEVVVEGMFNSSLILKASQIITQCS